MSTLFIEPRAHDSVPTMNEDATTKDPSGSGKRESLSTAARLVIAAFIFINVAVPAGFSDLYPFSRYTMFSHKPEQLTQITATKPDGTPINLESLGFFHTYLANPHFRQGWHPP